MEHHVKAAREAGATADEIRAAIKMAQKIRQVTIDRIEKKAEELRCFE